MKPPAESRQIKTGFLRDAILVLVGASPFLEILVAQSIPWANPVDHSGKVLGQGVRMIGAPLALRAETELGGTRHFISSDCHARSLKLATILVPLAKVVI